jgi:hypothetical protein
MFEWEPPYIRIYMDGWARSTYAYVRALELYFAAGLAPNGKVLSTPLSLSTKLASVCAF